MEVMGTIESKIGFYIGDPCYILSDLVYHEFWGNQCGYRNGVFQSVPGYDIGGFAVAETDFGDGCYVDQNGTYYPVDSGTLAVVSLELADPEKMKVLVNGKDGCILDSPGIAEFNATDGFFYIEIDDDRVIIDTK